MPIRKHIFIPGYYYHIYNRGHNKEQIFFYYKDYQRYLNRLKECLTKHPVTLAAYCPMPNHLHLLLRQDDEEPIERFIHRLHTSYTMYFNIRYERVGAVFQGRYKAKLINSDEYLLHVSRYIHQNSLELLHAQGPALKLQFREYPWSSYQEYIKSTPSPLCNSTSILNYFQSTKKPSLTKRQLRLRYQHFVEEGLEQLKSSKEKLAEISNGIF